MHFKSRPEIARAWTLPAELYWDTNILLAEKEKIFSRTWQVVGRGSQVANPGDYFTTDLMGEPLLFVRGSDAKLRGFYNVCRHRAGPAVSSRVPRMNVRARRRADQRYGN
jgi:choline monooxygenase